MTRRKSKKPDPSNPPAWPKVGDRVNYHSVIGEPATQLDMVVRAGPQVMCDSWVVWLEGKAGCVHVEASSRSIERTDGLGNPLVPDALYFVQDSRSCVGNCGSWWSPNGQGYCCDIDQVGKYTGEQVASMRGTDVPWPVEHALKHTVRHVRVDTQAFDRRNYKPGDR